MSPLDKLVEFFAVGGIVLGIVAFLLSLPTRSRPDFLPVPPFALPLLTLGLVFWTVARLRAARLIEQDVPSDGTDDRT
jgi:hypothetical protein